METVILPDVTHDCFSKNERKMLHSDNNSNNKNNDDQSTNSVHGSNEVIVNKESSSPAIEKNINASAAAVVPSFISLMNKDVQPMSLTDREDLLTLAQHKFDEIRRGSKGFSLFSNRKSQQQLGAPSSSSSSAEPLPKSVQMLSTLLYLSLMMHKVEDVKQILMQADPKSYHEWQNLFDVLHSPVFFSNERSIQNTRVKKIFKRKQTYKHKLIEIEKKLAHQKDLTHKIQAHANETTNHMSDSIQKLTEEASKSKDALNEKQKVEMKLLLASKEIELLRSNVTSLDSEIARSNHQLYDNRDIIKTMDVERAQYMKEIEIIREQEKKLEGVVIGLTKEVDDKRTKLDSLSEKLASSKIIHEDAISKWNEKYIQAKEETVATGVELKSTKEFLIRSQVDLQEAKGELQVFQKKHESTTLEMHEKSLSVKESTAITETELRFTKQLLEEKRQDLNHTKEALAISVKALAESRAYDIKETLRLKELLYSSKSEHDHLNEKLKDTELKANDLSYSKQSLREEHEAKCSELKNAVIKLEADLKQTEERAQQAEEALDYSATVSKLVDEKSKYLKENEKLKQEMESKNYELAQLNGHLEYTERKVNETLQEKEERSILNDEKCNQLKNILIKLEDEVKMHSSRAQKAEDNVDLVAILKALVEEKAIELRSRDKLNELLHSNSCEVNKLNERLKDSSIKVNDLSNDKKLITIHHQRECTDLRDKVSILESEVTSSSNRVKIAEEKFNVAKSLSKIVDERNKEVEANEKLKEMVHMNQCELIQYREKLKQSETKIEALVSDKASTKELHNKEYLEMSDRTLKLQNEIETCTNRAMKAEENLNLSNALSSLIEDKASDTKANETMLELLNSNKKELSLISEKLKETELNINNMVNEKMLNSFEKVKESELEVNNLRRDSKSADDLYQKQCMELNDKIIELQTEVASYSERAQNAEKNLNLANSIAELIEERNMSSTSLQNITELLDENKSDLAELNENILGTENKITTLIDKKMVHSNEKLDDSLLMITKLKAEKRVHTEACERERNEQKIQILGLQSEIKSSREMVQKAEENMQLAHAIKALTEDKILTLKQHEEITKLIDSNKDDLNILKDQSKQADSKLTKLNQVENEIRDIIKEKMIHSNKKLLETDMNMKALIADKQLNETIHEMECNEMGNRLVELENVVSIYKSRALKAEDNLNLANILTALAEEKNANHEHEDSIDELLEFNKRALLAFNENLQELDSKIDVLVESREADKKIESKNKDEPLNLVEKTLLNFQSELNALKNKALHAEETLKVANSYASFTEAVDIKYDKLSKLLESNKEELNRLNQNLYGTDSKISQLLTSGNVNAESNDSASIAEKLSNIESILEASTSTASKEFKESDSPNEKMIHIACDDKIPLASNISANIEIDKDQKDDNKDDCVSAITSENFEFYIPSENAPNSSDQKAHFGNNLNSLERRFVTSEETKNPSTESIAKDTTNTSISSKNFENDSSNENASIGEIIVSTTNQDLSGKEDTKSSATAIEENNIENAKSVPKAPDKYLEKNGPEEMEDASVANESNDKSPCESDEDAQHKLDEKSFASEDRDSKESGRQPAAVTISNKEELGADNSIEEINEFTESKLGVADESITNVGEESKASNEQTQDPNEKFLSSFKAKEIEGELDAHSVGSAVNTSTNEHAINVAARFEVISATDATIDSESDFEAAQQNEDIITDDNDSTKPLEDKCNENSNKEKNIALESNSVSSEPKEAFQNASEETEQSMGHSSSLGNSTALNNDGENEAALNNNISVTPPNSDVEDDSKHVEVTLEDSSLQEGLSVAADPNNNSTMCDASSDDEVSVSDMNSLLNHRDVAVEVVNEALETATSNVVSHHDSTENS